MQKLMPMTDSIIFSIYVELKFPSAIKGRAAYCSMHTMFFRTSQSPTPSPPISPKVCMSNMQAPRLLSVLIQAVL